MLSEAEARDLYEEQARPYDASLLLFNAAGLRRWRADLVDDLGLSVGDTVVDLCHGTGENLLILARAVNGGRVVGVDLPPCTRAVQSILRTEMVPTYEDVIARTAQRLPTGGSWFDGAQAPGRLARMADRRRRPPYAALRR